MEGRLCTEFETDVPCADFETDLPCADLWEVYGTLLLELLPQLFSEIEVVEGNGGVGTILLVTSPPTGTPELESFKEKFTIVDNEKYIKEAEMIEGGFLDHGFQKYLVQFKIVEKEDGTSIIRSTIEYKVDAMHANNASLVGTESLASIAEAITKYIKEQKSPKQDPQ